MFLFLAAVGLVLSLVAHASTFVGMNPARHFPATWLLHLGIFVVFAPAIVAANRMGKGASRNEVWNSIWRFAPRWLQCLVGAFFVYAFFNFFMSNYLNEGGVPGKINGEYVLHSHGKVIRKLTPDEYDKHESYVVRGFSGHWMFFYSASLMILAASERAQRAMNTAKNGSIQELAEAEAKAGDARGPTKGTSIKRSRSRVEFWFWRPKKGTEIQKEGPKQKGDILLFHLLPRAAART